MQPQIVGEYQVEPPSVKVSLGGCRLTWTWEAKVPSRCLECSLQCLPVTAPGLRRRKRGGFQGADTLELAASGHWCQALAALHARPQKTKCCCQAHQSVGTPGPRNVLLVEQADKGRECSQVGRGHPSFSGQWGLGTPGVGRRPVPGTSDWQVLLRSRVMFSK